MKQRILIAFVLLLVPIAGAQVYTITDLGPLSPTAINTWGQVVGNRGGHAWIWTRFGGFEDLGLLPGGNFSMAASINDLGEVVGTADGIGVESYADFPANQCTGLIQPFVWTRTTGMNGLGTRALNDGFPWVDNPCFIPEFATKNNILGQVVGYTGAFATYQYGFLFSKDSWISYGPFGDTPDSANAVNRTGQVVGQVGDDECTGCSPGHAASWTNGVMVDLGTLGGTDPHYLYGSSANDVNDQGQIVGWSGTSVDTFDGGTFHAVLWTKTGSIRDLGTLPGDTISTAWRTNFFGQVIGSSGNTRVYTLYDATLDPCCSLGVSGRPFIWSEHRGMRDLNTLIRANSGWVVKSATDINVWGQIVGSGTLNGQPRGFLLTPKELFDF
jgi:probable HAF family extracellular repeat protein